MYYHTLGDFQSAQSRDRYLQLTDLLAKDRFADFPAWARPDPATALDGRKIVACGTKMIGEAILAAQNFHLHAVVDDTLKKQNSHYLGVPVLTTEEWIRMAKADSDVVSLILANTSPAFNHFARAVAQNNLKALKAIDLLRISALAGKNVTGAGTTFVYGLPFYEDAVANAETHLKLAEKFADDYSRLTYFNLLNYRITSNPAYLDQCAIRHNTHPDQSLDSYAINRSFFDIGDDEVYVDGGGFTGDTVAQFIHAVRGQFRKIYCFEPAPAMLAECRKTFIRTQNVYPRRFLKDIVLVDKGLWNKVDVLSFNSSLFSGEESELGTALPQSAHIVESGLTGHLYDESVEKANSVQIPVTSIDECCEGPVSLIKLEIEGSEPQALEGAARTIERHRPKLAVSVYHMADHLHRLPQQVLDFDQGYWLFLRQHNPAVPDATVCYCA